MENISTKISLLILIIALADIIICSAKPLQAETIQPGSINYKRDVRRKRYISTTEKVLSRHKHSVNQQTSNNNEQEDDEDDFSGVDISSNENFEVDVDRNKGKKKIDHAGTALNAIPQFENKTVETISSSSAQFNENNSSLNKLQDSFSLSFTTPQLLETASSSVTTNLLTETTDFVSANDNSSLNKQQDSFNLPFTTPQILETASNTVTINLETEIPNFFSPNDTSMENFPISTSAFDDHTKSTLPEEEYVEYETEEISNETDASGGIEEYYDEDDVSEETWESNGLKPLIPGEQENSETTPQNETIQSSDVVSSEPEVSKGRTDVDKRIPKFLESTSRISSIPIEGGTSGTTPQNEGIRASVGDSSRPNDLDIPSRSPATVANLNPFPCFIFLVIFYSL